MNKSIKRVFVHIKFYYAYNIIHKFSNKYKFHKKIQYMISGLETRRTLKTRRQKDHL